MNCRHRQTPVRPVWFVQWQAFCRRLACTSLDAPASDSWQQIEPAHAVLMAAGRVSAGQLCMVVS